MTIVRTTLYVDGVPLPDGSDDVSPASARQRAEERGGFAWIALVDADADELERLGEELGVHPIALRESLRTHQRSIFERYGDDVFVVLQPARYDDASETVRCDEVDVFLSEALIVTVTRSDRIDVDDARRRIEGHPDLLRHGPSAVLWVLMELTTGGYRAVLDGVENDIDEIEDQIFGDDPGVSRRIFDLQREVIDLAHATTPLPDVLARLASAMQDPRLGREPARWDDLRGRAQYVADRVLSMRHTLDDALTIHATLVNQRLDEKMAHLTEVQVRQNDQVKKISSWAAIGFAPTFVASVYGMNFRFMPELDQPWGYPMALGIMVLLSAGLYGIFKRNDWL
ncbi:magnesium and cobalt transport protein CorA [Microbacterium oleivorans]|uniref:Magnesium and cobalt transport protein CorA n=1 Tax=Microbacterium oleivorans TaxID=273677 RepID=A0A7D5IVP8_9MICO|nr:magnesium and cobalt transport protein CorA [Microbacterium oleivorans]QLD10656.1 magnesium and cobalt transport protein CorA [Microbacterium oleivorans]